MFWKITISSVALALPLGFVAAAEKAPAVDKSGYTIFKRTPESQLRELTTDRPDLTESPYTVDAGWWQVEMDFFNNTLHHDKTGGADVKASVLGLGIVNLKVGLTNSIDLQTVIETHTRVKIQDRIAGTRTTVSGFGDTISRLKINFWGNDGGESAFGLMPFVKWPTNQHGLGNKSVEGGLIIPYAHALSGGWDMGLMTEFDFVRNEADDGYATDWLNTITFGHDIVGRLGGYLELTYLVTRGPAEATFDCGLTYGVGKHAQLDAGVNLGLSGASPDINFFTGLSFRF